jgi:hypothetical protein
MEIKKNYTIDMINIESTSVPMTEKTRIPDRNYRNVALNPMR